MIVSKELTELDFLSFQLKELMDDKLDEAEQEILESKKQDVVQCRRNTEALEASLLILDSSEISVSILGLAIFKFNYAE